MKACINYISSRHLWRHDVCNIVYKYKREREA